MKISTKGRYGLRALADLAAYSQGEPIALAMVAARQKISLNYLEQVIRTASEGWTGAKHQRAQRRISAGKAGKRYYGEGDTGSPGRGHLILGVR